MIILGVRVDSWPRFTLPPQSFASRASVWIRCALLLLRLVFSRTATSAHATKKSLRTNTPSSPRNLYNTTTAAPTFPIRHLKATPNAASVDLDSMATTNYGRIVGIDTRSAFCVFGKEFDIGTIWTMRNFRSILKRNTLFAGKRNVWRGNSWCLRTRSS